MLKTASVSVSAKTMPRVTRRVDVQSPKAKVSRRSKKKKSQIRSKRKTRSNRLVLKLKKARRERLRHVGKYESPLMKPTSFGREF